MLFFLFVYLFFASAVTAQFARMIPNIMNIDDVSLNIAPQNKGEGASFLTCYFPETFNIVFVIPAVVESNWTPCSRL